VTTQHTTGPTMSRPATLLAGIALLALAGSACGPGKTSTGSAGVGDASTATGDGTGAAGTEGTGSGSGSGTTGSGGVVGCQQFDDADYAAWAAQCEAAADEGTCRTAIPEAAQCAQCVWEDWVPTTLDENGQCVYGPVTGACKFEAFGDGCEESWTNCKPGLSMYRVTDSGQVELHLGEYCIAKGQHDGLCAVDDQGKAYDSVAPECTCICDPNFPG